MTQLVTWIAGVAAVALAAHTAWAAEVVFGAVSLATMNFASQVLAGVAVGSAASLVQDALKAADSTQSEAKATLLGSRFQNPTDRGRKSSPPPCINP